MNSWRCAWKRIENERTYACVQERETQTQREEEGERDRRSVGAGWGRYVRDSVMHGGMKEQEEQEEE